ncbi:MAG: DnaD domain protein [Parasporobacterium sp.]|nr:DnaD domain protein [Parasporobacterium sp.]
MSKFALSHEGLVSSTGIPNNFIENYMPRAAGEFVKIYIYLLKCLNENQSELSLSKIADVFDNTTKDIMRALKYWQKKGLLKLTVNEEGLITNLVLAQCPDGEPTEVTITEPAAEKAAAAVNVQAEPAASDETLKKGACAAPEANVSQTAAEEPAAADVPSADVPPQAQWSAPPRKAYSRAELERFSEQEEVRGIIHATEKLIKKNLKQSDINTMLYIYDSLGFSLDLIDALIDRCVADGITTAHATEKVALDWAEQGITSMEALSARLKSYSPACNSYRKAINHPKKVLTTKELGYINTWTGEYGFSPAQIEEAVAKAFDYTEAPSAAYINKIIKSWYDKREAAKNPSSARKSTRSKKGFNNFSQPVVNYEDIAAELFV